MEGREVDGVGVRKESGGNGSRWNGSGGMSAEGREVDGMGVEEGEWREWK